MLEEQKQQNYIYRTLTSWYTFQKINDCGINGYILPKKNARIRVPEIKIYDNQGVLDKRIWCKINWNVFG